MSDQPELLDHTYIQENYLDVGFRDLLIEVLSLFGAQAAAHLASIHTALETHNTALIAEHAHTLQGSAGSVGARAICCKAKELEKTAGTGDLEKTQHTITELASIIALTDAAVTQELTRLAESDDLNLF